SRWGKQYNHGWRRGRPARPGARPPPGQGSPPIPAPAAAPAVPGDWMPLGACQVADPDLFFPIAALGPAQQQIVQAKAICAACLVRTACLRYALETGQDAGIWGGTTEDERREIRSGRTAPPTFPPSCQAGPR